jgi:hypothetical protein
MGGKVADPMELIQSVGTIDVRSHSSRANTPIDDSVGADVGISGEGGDASGWSQEIGGNCEAIAFRWIYGQYEVRQLDHMSESLVRIRRIDGVTREVERLNVPEDRCESWDIEERDLASGRIERRYEVKAPSAKLTESQARCAIRHGASYWILRVYPDTHRVERLALQPNWSSPVEPAVRHTVRSPVVENKFPHKAPRVGSRASEDYKSQVAEWRRTKPIVVGTGRSSRVELFELTAADAVRFGWGDDSIVAFSRSPVGEERLTVGLSDSRIKLLCQSRRHQSSRVIVVTATSITGERALVMALASALKKLDLPP